MFEFILTICKALTIAFFIYVASEVMNEWEVKNDAIISTWSAIAIVLAVAVVGYKLLF
uniref:Uncharacterized protein n=1 Tax=viral metagenome TaxID=1070528 RepID=A0A6M3JXF3_9ZZZZ